MASFPGVEALTLADGEGIKAKKHGKKRKHDREETSDDLGSPTGASAVLSPANKVPKTIIRQELEEPHSKISDGEWSNEQINHLLDNLEQQSVTKEAKTIKYSTMADRLNWEALRFDPFTANECKEKWLYIVTKVRRFRIIPELLEDARSWAKTPWAGGFYNKKQKQHPDAPKKPLTTFLRFYLKKHKQVVKENPNLKNSDISKVIGELFRQLPEKKKKKYADAYLQDKLVYDIKYNEFLESHPECQPVDKSGETLRRTPGRSSAKIKGPKPPLTPLQLFVQHKVEEFTSKHAGEKKPTFNSYQKKYADLSDSKKLKWINKSLEDINKYQAEVKEFQIKEPELVPKVVVLTKAEQKLKDESLGRPEKPFPNAYSYFTRELMNSGEVSSVENTKRMTVIGHKWKSLSEVEKEKYVQTAAKNKEEYPALYAKWKDTLSTEDLKRVEKEEIDAAIKQADNASKRVTPSTSKKPVSGMFIYINEKKEKYKEKNPDKSPTDVSRLLSKEYQDLPDNKKEKYKKKAELQKSSPATSQPAKKEDSPVKPTAQSDSSESGSSDSESSSSSDNDGSDSSDSDSSMDSAPGSPQVPNQHGVETSKKLNSNEVYSSSSDSDSDSDSD